MITRLLAATNCRDGNCPTVWATDHDTVVVQGYSERAQSPYVRTVRVPAPILDAAADSMRHSAVPTIPVQAGPATEYIERDGSDYLVTGRCDTPDVEARPAPTGEEIVELPAIALTRLLVREEAAA